MIEGIYILEKRELTDRPDLFTGFVVEYPPIFCCKYALRGMPCTCPENGVPDRFNRDRDPDESNVEFFTLVTMEFVRSCLLMDIEKILKIYAVTETGETTSTLLPEIHKVSRWAGCSVRLQND